MLHHKQPTSESRPDRDLLIEVKTLFEFVPPESLRRHITDIFFYALMNKDFDLAAQQGAVEDLFVFLQFLEGLSGESRTE